MRLAKLSTDEFGDEAALESFFTSELPRRSPPGLFLIGNQIAADGLNPGETVLFTYRGRLRYIARAESSRQKNTYIRQDEYPYCIILDPVSVQRADVSLDEVEQQLRAQTGLELPLHGRGWTCLPDGDWIPMFIQQLVTPTNDPDPFAIRMVFLRIGWMTAYRGITGGDSISSGGAYVAQHGFGHEIFNFQPFQGAVYGYVQPPARKDQWEEAKINLSRLGASADDKSVSGIFTVWVATSPTGGAFVVGWYKNATIYRAWEPPPAGSSRRYSDVDCGYYVTANSEEAVLLPPDERVFSIPQQGKGAFGQSNIWYADDPAQHRRLRLDVLRYVELRRMPKAQQGQDSTPHQSDPLLRQTVERIAVETTVAYFAGLGYLVESVEKDNVGWDLNAASGKRLLKLEVKGLSGSQILVELSPNEYAAMGANKESYRVCVVTNALTKPCLEVFAYSTDSKRWESAERRVLNIKEIVGARCSAM